MNYLLQFDVVGTDSRGELLTVCFHGPGRMGFDTIDEAKTIVEGLKKADAALDNAESNYEIRPVYVAEDFQVTNIDVDQDELFDLLKSDDKEGESGDGGGGVMH